jgi:hypothetical protein
MSATNSRVRNASGGWPTHKSGCPIHDGFIVMGGVRTQNYPLNVTQITSSASVQTISWFRAQPSERYQTEGHYHFLTFSCYRRLAYLIDDHSRRAAHI